MDCCKDTGANNRGSYCAVGTMYPGIEIWDLDCIDAVEPAATLGGYDTADVKKSSSGGKSKPKVKKEGHQGCSFRHVMEFAVSKRVSVGECG